MLHAHFLGLPITWYTGIGNRTELSLAVCFDVSVSPSGSQLSNYVLCVNVQVLERLKGINFMLITFLE